MPPPRRPGDDARTVWSSEAGDLRKPAARGGGRRVARTDRTDTLPADGVVRVKREIAGRRGKPVTTVHGVPAADLKALATDLKRRCGSGGSAKNGIIEIQGDHRDVVVAELEARGYAVKRAGG